MGLAADEALPLEVLAADEALPLEVRIAHTCIMRFRFPPTPHSWLRGAARARRADT